MKITLLSRFRPLIRELSGIHRELKRMNDMRELELAHQGLYATAPRADTSGPDPVALYTNEQADYYRELQEELGQLARGEAE